MINLIDNIQNEESDFVFQFIPPSVRVCGQGPRFSGSLGKLQGKDPIPMKTLILDPAFPDPGSYLDRISALPLPLSRRIWRHASSQWLRHVVHRWAQLRLWVADGDGGGAIRSIRSPGSYRPRRRGGLLPGNYRRRVQPSLPGTNAPRVAVQHCH